jgi:CRP-like cAMP-binding protein
MVDERSSGLERSSLLADLGEPERAAVIARMAGTLKRYPKHTVVCHQGDPGESIHFIEQGFVGVIVSGRGGREVMIRVIGPGGTFGEQALLSPSGHRTATIETLTATETRRLSRADFDELRRAHPAVERLLVASLAAQVRRMSEQIVELVELPAAVRLYRRLVEMSDMFEPVAGGDIPLTQKQLALLAGTEERAINGVINEAKRDGVLASHRGQVTVLDWERLRSRARLPGPHR